MSTVPAHPPPMAAAVPNLNEVTVVSHSNLFYWWPVWAVALLMALITYIEGTLMVTVPPGTEARADLEVPVKKKDAPKALEKRDILILPENKKLTRDPPHDLEAPPMNPRLHMTRNKSLGVVFCTILLLVIVITNVPLRGMWSVVVIITIIMLSLILHLAGAWEWIIAKLSILDVRINMGGYLLIATVLFIMWLVTIVFFDKQIYMVFTPGQLKVRTEIGGGEKVYDAIGMTLEKQRGDVFRHRILGLGSGDLIVKTSGAQAHQFDLPNVLFISKKVQQIEDMLKKKQVIETR